MVVFELFQPKKININLELYRLSRTQTLTKEHKLEKAIYKIYPFAFEEGVKAQRYHLMKLLWTTIKIIQN